MKKGEGKKKRPLLGVGGGGGGRWKWKNAGGIRESGMSSPGLELR